MSREEDEALAAELAELRLAIRKSEYISKDEQTLLERWMGLTVVSAYRQAFEPLIPQILAASPDRKLELSGQAQAAAEARLAAIQAEIKTETGVRGLVERAKIELNALSEAE